MASRYRALAAYSALLAAGAGAWLAFELTSTPAFPPAWIVAIAVVACLFVFQFGLSMRIGLISMERVPQIGLLLVFSPAVAAAICATASFIWPLFNRSYSQGSTTFAALRALHNAAMTIIMLLAAGAAYTAAGGQYPLADVGLADLWPLAAMAIVATYAASSSLHTCCRTSCSYRPACWLRCSTTRADLRHSYCSRS
jgi:hypothetical protein